MATYRVTDPRTGKTLKLTGDSPPSEAELEQIFSSVQAQQKSMEGLARNYIADIQSNVGGAMELAAPMLPPLRAMKMIQGENVDSPSRTVSAGRAIGEGLLNLPQQLAQTVRHPIESAYQRPLSTALDLSMIGQGVGAGMGLARAAGGAVTRRAAPAILRTTAGAPEMATKIALEKPSVLRQAPLPESELNRAVGQPMIDTMKAAKKRVQNNLGKAYEKYAGVKNPVDELIEGESRPRRSFDELRQDYKLAKEGNLFIEGAPNKTKLKTLTELKRDIQTETNFNKAPVTLQPIDTVKDAALKKMGAEVDEIRSSIPNGKKLERVDNAYKELNDIYDTVQKDLSDPGKAKDTMMRLIRGDTTWLTQGRMAGKVDAIRKAEKLTGKKILDPALEELTRQVFSQWTGKGIGPNAMRLVATGLGGLGVAAPAALPFAAASLAASSPKIAGAGLKAINAFGEGASKITPKASTVIKIAGINTLSNVAKVLDEKQAKKYLRKAKGDKEKARDMAIKDGYEIPE